MIDLNLLPDSKLARLKEKRVKQLTISISTVVILASVGLPVFLFVSDLLLQRVIASKQEKIDTLRREFENKEEVQKILTVQSQLRSIPGVEDQRYFASNLLEVIEHVTPNGVAITSLTAINEDGTFEIQILAPTVGEANRIVDSLDAIEIVDPDDEKNTISPFDELRVESFSDDSDDPVTFTVEGTLNQELGSIEKINKFLLNPYKVELGKQKNKEIENVKPSSGEGQ